MSHRHNHDEHISPQEAAELLGVTDRTVQRYIKSGHIAAKRLPGGRLLRIRRADVEKLLSTEAASS